MLKTPVIGYKINAFDILAGLGGFMSGDCRDGFREALSSFVPSKNIWLVNSGTSAFYTILQSLKTRSPKKEVILPAHAARCLVNAIRKAGLKPVLCNISLKDFNMNVHTVREAITSQTLCVVCVHMFGMPVRGIEEMKGALPDDVYLVEDCAQAMGAEIGGELVGSFGDAAIFSFNRGKHLPTYGGGALAVNSEELKEEIKCSLGRLDEAGFIEELSMLLKFTFLSVLFRPLFYSLAYPLMSSVKSGPYPDDFSVNQYTPVQAKLGTALLKRFEESVMKRRENARIIHESLNGDEGIGLPELGDSIKPSFNRMPLIVKDISRKQKIESALKQAGIQSANMDVNPLHHVYDLGYDSKSFSNVLYLTEHLIALPVHPLLSERDMGKLVSLIISTK